MVTINDVAKEAGVSITTVSRVINNNYPVKKETREKVEEVIKKLNFTPNQMARSLITKKTYTIGVVVPGITNLFFSTVVENIEKCIKKIGYSISLGNTFGDGKEERKLIENFITRHVDGIIVMDPSEENLSNNFYKDISSKVPLLIINALGKGLNCNYICYDEESGIKEALEYLFSMNHSRIAFIRGEKSISYDVREKIYKDFIKTKNIPYEKVVKVKGGNSVDGSINVEKKLVDVFKKEELPTAIFASNDLMAVGVLNYCKKAGIKVPEEVSIIGCDNTFLTDITYPRITSIDIGIDSLGEIAASEILNLIDNDLQITKRVVLGTKLIIKESCSKYNLK